MKIYFTLEVSFEVQNKFDALYSLEDDISAFFENKFYSNDLSVLYICVFCMSPKFAEFYAPRKPKYTSRDKKYLYKGVELSKEAKTFEYELRLDFSKYVMLSDVRKSLARDVIQSLYAISACNQIKNINIAEFRLDLEIFFSNNKWL